MSRRSNSKRAHCLVKRAGSLCEAAAGSEQLSIRGAFFKRLHVRCCSLHHGLLGDSKRGDSKLTRSVRLRRSNTDRTRIGSLLFLARENKARDSVSKYNASKAFTSKGFA